MRNASTPSVETILAQAVEIAEPEPRQAFVEQACGGNAELKRQVERLIANHFQAGSFLERPAVAIDPDGTAGWETETASGVGTVIGPYKLLEQIGEGGMGLVYVAQQQEPIKRRVALKIIKPGMDSRQVIARFEAERQVESETLKQVGYDEMRRIIREEEPPRPSTRLSTIEQAALSTIAERRGLEPRRLSQQLRGELDWIVMKALEKDRTRRYETANDFAADIKRYLNHEPVAACSPSVRYRLRKFAHRNKVALTTSSLLAVTLLLGTAVSIW